MNINSPQGIGTGLEDSAVVTSCCGCIFAETEGKKQTGCEIGRLDKFISLGTDIQEAENEKKEEFYVIRRLCNAYRNEEWGEYWKDKNKRLKKWVKMFTFLKGMKAVERAAFSSTYKSVWCAGPSIEYTEKVLPVKEIANKFIA